MSYLKESYSTRSTPQSEALEGQVPNSAGGHAWAVDDWARLRRFLILGSEGGSYYVGERQLTRESAKAVGRCIAEDGARAVKEIVEVSEAGRAPKNDPAIFALAMAASSSDAQTRRLALQALPNVCRIGTHLFTFAGYVENFRGWGRGLRSAVARWYERDDLAYQLVKYRQRGGWSHRDLLRLAHPAHSELLSWAAGKYTGTIEGLPEPLRAFHYAQAAPTPRDTARILHSCPDLPREALNPEHLKAPEVWEALLANGMPMTALLRNLGNMSRAGVVAPMSAGAGTVAAQIADAGRISKARVHPLAVLVALMTYQSGHGVRGGGEWTPVQQVVDALNGAFYAAFGNVEPTGLRTLLALDVSSSMDWGAVAGLPGISPRVGAGAMALVTAAVELRHHVMAFSHRLVPVSISPTQRLDDVCNTLSQIPMGGTDCALPMLWAARERVEVDTFVVYTDSETWAGLTHPAEALRAYRRATGIPAKLVVVGMLSNGFSIADPDDPGMLDVVGFDTATPNVLSEFALA